jgi:hypothetical protein
MGKRAQALSVSPVPLTEVNRTSLFRSELKKAQRLFWQVEAF